MATSSFEKPLIIRNKRALEVMEKGFERPAVRRPDTPRDIDTELRKGRALLCKVSYRLKASSQK